jgi:hypothetical protein
MVDELDDDKDCNVICSVMPENFEDSLEEKILNNKSEIDEQIMDDKFVIVIPTFAKKEDLLELKEFLALQKS